MRRALAMDAAGLTIAAGDENRNAAVASRSEFLATMAHHAAAVAVVTVAHGGHVHAVTVSSLVSVSADPPTILVSLCHASRLLAAILQARRFGVSLLAADQELIARSCANPRRGPLPASALGSTADGVPLLTGAAATLALELVTHIPIADHVLLIGRVRVAAAYDRPPLLYHDRHYRGLALQE